MNVVSVNDRLERKGKVTHKDQNVLDFIFPAFALLFIFPHPQLSHRRPVLSIYFLLYGLGLYIPLSVKSRYADNPRIITGALCSAICKVWMGGMVIVLSQRVPPKTMRLLRCISLFLTSVNEQRASWVFLFQCRHPGCPELVAGSRELHGYLAVAEEAWQKTLSDL